MTPDAGTHSGHGGGATTDRTRDLAMGHSPVGFHEDPKVQSGQLLPVGSGKSLRAEGFSAGFTGKPLYAMWGCQSPEVADFFELPGTTRIVVV